MPFLAFVVKKQGMASLPNYPLGSDRTSQEFILPTTGITLERNPDNGYNKYGSSMQSTKRASYLSFTSVLILMVVIILFVVVPMILIYRNLNNAIKTLNSTVNKIDSTEKTVNAFITKADVIVNDIAKVEEDVSRFKNSICNSILPFITPQIKHDLGCPGY